MKKKVNPTWNTALFILKALEVHKVSQSSMNHLLGDISEYLDMVKGRLLHRVAAALKDKGIAMEDVLATLSNSPDVADPFSGLRSEYSQTQYFIRHFNLVVNNIKEHVSFQKCISNLPLHIYF